MRRKDFCFIFAVLFLLFFSCLTFAKAQEMEEKGSENTANFIEGLIILFIVTSIVLCANIVKKFKTSLFGTPFVYILMGLFLMGIIRLIFVFNEFKIFSLHEESLVILWHMVFYTSSTSFFIALDKIKKTAKGNMTSFTRKDSIILAVLLVSSVTIFALAQPLNEWIVSWFRDELGIQHFIAFAFAGLLASRLLWIKINKKYSGELISAIIPSFIIFLSLMSFVHFWELLTESWKIIHVPGATIELVEQIIWVPAFAIMSYGILQVNLVIKKTFSAVKK